MADIPEPGSLVSIATVVGTAIGAAVAAVLGLRKARDRAERGVADGDHVQASGIFVDSVPLTKLVTQVKRVADEMAATRRWREEQAEKAEQAERAELREQLRVAREKGFVA